MSALELLDEHKKQPRNLGKIVGCDAVGDVGSIVVGDALRFFLNIEDERIAEAKFQVFGAAEMIAAASVLSEMLPGKTIQEARRLQPRHICEYLGDLDRYQLPAQIWALDAMNAALDMYQGLDTPRDEDMDALVCRCHGVSDQQVRDAITEDSCDTVDKVAAMTFASSGCGSCRNDVQKIIDDVLEPDKPHVAEQAATGVSGRIPMMRKIAAIVEQEFQEPLSVDGSVIELWDLAGNQVIIKLSGPIADADEAAEHLLDRLQRRLQDEVESSLSVLRAEN